MSSTATVSEVKKNGVVPYVLERVLLESLTRERMLSFQKAITDFIEHSEERGATLFHIWNWIYLSILRQTVDEIWWALKDDQVVCYFINTPQQNWTGQFELFINHGWASSSVTKHQKKAYLNFIVEDAFKRGVSRVSFSTHRNPKAFQKFLNKKWKESGVLFEIRNLEDSHG